MTQASRAELRAELMSRIPRWYSPWAHLVFPAVSGIAIAVFALSRVQDLRAWQLALVPVFLAFGNAVEWHAHRGLLHRRTRFLEVLYVRHTPQHHAIFVHDDLALHAWRELKLVLLPAYGILAILAATSPITFALVWLGQPNLAALWVASVVVYVLSYEWLHLAYHLPEGTWIGRARGGGLRAPDPLPAAAPRPPPRAPPHATLELQRDPAALGSGTEDDVSPTSTHLRHRRDAARPLSNRCRALARACAPFTGASRSGTRPPDPIV
jgi:hypothetical protein